MYSGFKDPNERLAGVLCPLSSIPTVDAEGIGVLGSASKAFIDWMVAANLSYWQLLPLNHSDKSGSPYAGPSTFGGDPLYISLRSLIDWGLLSERAWDDAPQGFRVDYPTLRKWKAAHLETAAQEWWSSNPQAKASFEQESAYCAFMARSQQYGWKYWNWPESAPAIHQKNFRIQQFCQWAFHREWNELRSYAARQNISLIGDMPMFVGRHSLEVSSHPERFKLKPNLVLTGAPPDAFNQEGQSWGTPAYDWQGHEQSVIAGWLERVEYLLTLFDCIRIDHFLGLVHTWEIPQGAKSARSGAWSQVPGDQVLQAIQHEFSSMPFIVEDLGDVSDAVLQLRDKYQLPGMKVLQFGFDHDEQDQGENTHFPPNAPYNSVTYTGTHDTKTMMQWYHELDSQGRRVVNNAIGSSDGDHLHKSLLSLVLNSPAKLAILPIWDVLGLGAECRFNSPGTNKGNWQWRLNNTQLGSKEATFVRELVCASNRKHTALPTRQEV